MTTKKNSSSRRVPYFILTLPFDVCILLILHGAKRVRTPSVMITCADVSPLVPNPTSHRCVYCAHFSAAPILAHGPTPYRRTAQLNRPQITYPPRVGTLLGQKKDPPSGWSIILWINFPSFVGRTFPLDNGRFIILSSKSPPPQGGGKSLGGGYI